MSDKKMSETTDHELMLEYIEQFKEENKRLKQEIKDNKKPSYFISDKAFDHWTWGVVVIGAAIFGVIHLIGYMWPSTYETGRFYLEHTMKDYEPPKECMPSRVCNLPPGDRDSCYQVRKEIENGYDPFMSKCIRDKNEAFKMANEFTDEWEKRSARENRNE